MMETNTRAPQEKVCGYEYTVKRGDSFYLIAHRLGVPLRDLLEANANINPARLMVGDVLCIPIEEDDVPTPETQIPAVPVPLPETNETQPIPEPEPEPEPEPAVPAPEFTITEDVVPEPLPAESLDTPAAGPDVPAADSACSGTRYTVSPGETAADIQLDTGLSYHTLQSANPGKRIDQLTAGDVLCIPPENLPCPAAATYTIQPGENLESTALRLNASLSALLRANPCLAPADFVEGVCIAVPG